MKKLFFFLFLTAVIAFSYTTVFPKTKETNATEQTSSKTTPQIAQTPETLSAETPVTEQIPPTEVTKEQKQLALEPTTYTVQSGDTLGSIAQKFNISLATILSANNLTSRSVLHIGDILTIQPASGITYAIKSGDTILGIALRYDINQEEILTLNNLSKNSILHIGQKIILPNTPTVATKQKATPTKTPVAPKPVTSQPKVTTVAPTQTAPKTSTAITWHSDALQELNKMPSFVRPSVKSKIEAYAREHGITVITKAIYQSIHI